MERYKLGQLADGKRAVASLGTQQAEIGHLLTYCRALEAQVSSLSVALGLLKPVIGEAVLIRQGFARDPVSALTMIDHAIEEARMHTATLEKVHEAHAEAAHG